MTKRAANLPSTVKDLRTWLKGTTLGRKIVEELSEETLERKCRECTEPIRRNPRVLVVLRRLGNHAGAEVYAEDGVTARLMELPDAPDDAATGPLLEALIAAKLPRGWRPLVQCRARQINREVFRAMPAEEALEFAETLEAIKEMGRACRMDKTARSVMEW